MMKAGSRTLMVITSAYGLLLILCMVIWRWKGNIRIGHWYYQQLHKPNKRDEKLTYLNLLFSNLIKLPTISGTNIYIISWVNSNICYESSTKFQHLFYLKKAILKLGAIPKSTYLWIIFHIVMRYTNNIETFFCSSVPLKENW